LITADQLVCHALGDYLLQSDWMALEKTKRLWVALLHALAYSIPFLMLIPSMPAMAVIIGSHAIIDRYRLARYPVWLKNWLAPGYKPWSQCSGTGYDADRPAWMTVWLMIIADNVIHVAINGAALKWL
jgi:hypothetical protein